MGDGKCEFEAVQQKDLQTAMTRQMLLQPAATSEQLQQQQQELLLLL